MNDMSMQDILSTAAVAVLLMDIVVASIMKQRGKDTLARLVMAGGFTSAFLLLGIAYFAF